MSETTAAPDQTSDSKKNESNDKEPGRFGEALSLGATVGVAAFLIALGAASGVALGSRLSK